MKISLNWVKEFTKIELPPQDLKERVSVSLTEVERVENFGEIYKDIIVAEIEKIKEHPKSDGLLILHLDLGKSEVQVVVQKCPVSEGDKVPYLKSGLVIPETVGLGSGEVKVSKTDIKGTTSDGMVPSGRELGLNGDHTTVYTVPDDVAVGSAFEHSLDLVDQVMEIKNKALTHRPDTFSVVGLAREIAAIQGTGFTGLDWLENPASIKPSPAEDKFKLKIQNKAQALCSRYVAVVIDHIKVEPSPKWMQIRLAKMGVRPVNNVVDISNYLMLETGQPSHAFDYDKVISGDPKFKDNAIVTVRLAKEGESITTIDGQIKDLHDDTLIIADSTNPIGIAGVMGGKSTEISDDTNRIIFQVENLDMYSIRRTSKKVGLSTDAVTRFSKGLDPNLCEGVMYKAIEMFSEIAGGKIASKIHDDYRDPVKKHFVTISTDNVRSRIGVDIKDKEILDILDRLGLSVKKSEKSNLLAVEIPTCRRDLNIPEDINEEIVRIYGYDNVSPTLPVRLIRPVPVNKSRTRRLRMKEILKSAGANELYTYSFVGKKLYDKCGLDLQKAHKLLNPVSPELMYMRPVLLPSLLEKVPQNVHSEKEFACFEVDMVNPVIDGSAEKSGKSGKSGNLSVEPWHLALTHTSSYYHSKIYLERLFEGLYVVDYDIVSIDSIGGKSVLGWVKHAKNLYHPSRVAVVRIDKKVIGILGQIDVDTISELGLPDEISGFELRFDLLEASISDLPEYREHSRYPTVVHDFSFITDLDVPYSAIKTAVLRGDTKDSLIRSIKCKDIYANKDLGENKKTTISVVMQSDSKTLSENEIQAVRKSILKSVKKNVGGELAE